MLLFLFNKKWDPIEREKNKNWTMCLGVKMGNELYEHDSMESCSVARDAEQNYLEYFFFPC